MQTPLLATDEDEHDLLSSSSPSSSPCFLGTAAQQSSQQGHSCGGIGRRRDRDLQHLPEGCRPPLTGLLADDSHHPVCMNRSSHSGRGLLEDFADDCHHTTMISTPTTSTVFDNMMHTTTRMMQHNQDIDDWCHWDASSPFTTTDLLRTSSFSNTMQDHHHHLHHSPQNTAHAFITEHRTNTRRRRIRTTTLIPVRGTAGLLAATTLCTFYAACLLTLIYHGLGSEDWIQDAVQIQIQYYNNYNYNNKFLRRQDRGGDGGMSLYSFLLFRSTVSWARWVQTMFSNILPVDSSATTGISCRLFLVLWRVGAGSCTVLLPLAFLWVAPGWILSDGQRCEASRRRRPVWLEQRMLLQSSLMTSMCTCQKQPQPQSQGGGGIRVRPWLERSMKWSLLSVYVILLQTLVCENTFLWPLPSDVKWMSSSSALFSVRRVHALGSGGAAFALAILCALGTIAVLRSPPTTTLINISNPHNSHRNDMHSSTDINHNDEENYSRHYNEKDSTCRSLTTQQQQPIVRTPPLRAFQTALLSRLAAATSSTNTRTHNTSPTPTTDSIARNASSSSSNHHDEIQNITNNEDLPPTVKESPPSSPGTVAHATEAPHATEAREALEPKSVEAVTTSTTTMITATATTNGLASTRQPLPSSQLLPPLDASAETTGTTPAVTQTRRLHRRRIVSVTPCQKILAYELGLITLVLWLPILYAPWMTIQLQVTDNRYYYSWETFSPVLTCSDVLLGGSVWTQGIRSEALSLLWLGLIRISFVLQLAVVPMAANALGVMTWIGEGAWSVSSRRWLYCIQPMAAGLVFAVALLLFYFQPLAFVPTPPPPPHILFPENNNNRIIMNPQIIIDSYYSSSGSVAATKSSGVVTSASVQLHAGAWLYILQAGLLEMFLQITVKWSLV